MKEVSKVLMSFSKSVKMCDDVTVTLVTSKRGLVVMLSREFKKHWVKSNMPANNSTKITLTEDDIAGTCAGASLKITTASNLTIPELKRWLSCRKKKSKIKRPKADLVER